jgi:D-alanyl-D-alanine carboxypeptidase
VLEREVDARGVPGANASLTVDGTPVFGGAAGLLDAGSRLPIYSITKTFTAVAALRMAAPLDEPIDRWLPDLPFAKRVSLRQLLAQTAGVFNYSALAEYHEAVATSPGEPWSFDEFVARTCDRPLDFEPGTSWAYSNTGYTLAKRILEQHAEASFAQIVQHEVCEPAGLQATSVLEDLASMRALAPGFSAFFTPGMRGPDADVRGLYHPGWCATGVVASTTGDVCRFFDALFEGALISDERRREMLSLVRVPGQHPPAVRPSYGLGVMADPEGAPGAWLGHGGGGPGWNARATHFPDLAGHAVSIAVLCNHDADHAGPIARALALEWAGSRTGTGDRP